MPISQFREMLGQFKVKFIVFLALFLAFLLLSIIFSGQGALFASEPIFSKSTAATNEWTSVKSEPVQVQATGQPRPDALSPRFNLSEVAFQVFLPVILKPQIFTDEGVLVGRVLTAPGTGYGQGAAAQVTLTPPLPTVSPGATVSTPVPTPLPGSPTFTPTPKVTLTPTPTNTPTPILIPDGDFEGGGDQSKSLWDTFSLRDHRVIFDASAFSGPPVLPIVPTSGDAAAWLGGDDSEITYVQITYTIPQSHPFIAHRYFIYSPDPVCATNLFSDFTVATQFLHATALTLNNLQSDVGGLVITGATRQAVYVIDLCTAEATSNWGTIVYDTGAFAGEFVLIQFKTIGDSQVSSSFFIDDVVVKRDFSPFFTLNSSAFSLNSLIGEPLSPTIELVKPTLIIETTPAKTGLQK
jgi:hypothetical protein